MEDERVWQSEESLWRASEERYHDRIDPDCLMALSQSPWIFAGDAAVEAVSRTPSWDELVFSHREVRRPREGLIVVAYRLVAGKGETRFRAACTSVYSRRSHDDWTVVQHSQVVLDPHQSDA